MYGEAVEGSRGLSKFLDMVVEYENETSHEAEDLVGKTIHEKIMQLSDEVN